MAEDAEVGGAPRHFRFFDNREKYLLFVTTCSEKWAVAERVGRELERLRPTPPLPPKRHRKKKSLRRAPEESIHESIFTQAQVLPLHGRRH